MASKFLAGITQPHGASATSFLKPIAALVSYLSPSKYRKENTSDTPGVYQGEGPGGTDRGAPIYSGRFRHPDLLRGFQINNQLELRGLLQQIGFRWPPRKIPRALDAMEPLEKQKTS